MMYPVAPLADFEPDAGKRVTHNGYVVLVAVVDGVPYAVDDACLHNGASLSAGVIKDGCVTCPWHWWRFDLTNGELQGADESALRTYPCQVNDDGWVEVDIPAPAAARSLRETLLAHARGEL